MGKFQVCKGFKPKCTSIGAFSFVELLITLIILSLIMAAFIPLITKKLKASDITVGSFGGDGGGAIGIKRNVTKQDCDKLNAVFVEASVDVPKPLCVLKYNIGDMGNENWAGVQKCAAGDTTCKVKNGDSDKVTKDNLQPTCWQGKTADERCNAEFGNYDGCSRTVCNWTGANQMCSNYSLKGISGWRLPTKEELIALADDKYSSKDLGSKGLMLCDCSTSSTTAPMCEYLNSGCSGTLNGHCYPTNLWSSTFETSSIAKGRYLNGTWGNNTGHLGVGYSARCVLDSISDIVPPDGGTDLIDNKLDSQADCDKLGAGLLFIPKSTTGTKNMCVMKYNIGDMGNENWAGVQRCTAGAACSVTNATNPSLTKDNLTPTCWQGQTARAGCNDDFGGYDGCTRTVCNWSGANKLCENYRLGTYGWRLPTNKELTSFVNDTYSSKTAFENNGKSLMFCGFYAGNNLPVCPYREGGCSSTSDGNCSPAAVWSSSFDSSSSSFAQYWHFDNKWNNVSSYLSSSYSARCVLDEDAYRHANTNQIMPTETEFSSSCENGCALCANDKCYACKQGYELNNGKCVSHCLTMNNNGICVACKKGYALLNGKCLTCDPSNGFVKVDNLCVMQYNIGDGYYKEKWNGVQRCVAGNPCSVQNGASAVTKDKLTPACWQGKTAGDNCNANFGGYDGCTRTVCNWTGGEKMCNNIGWRLPTGDESKTFTNDTYSSKKAFESGNGSLMFCDGTNSTTHPQCQTVDNCLSAAESRCIATDIWTSTCPHTNGANHNHFNNGSWRLETTIFARPLSIRCVYDL